MRRDRLLIVLLIVIRRRSNGRSAVHGGNVALRALDRLDAAIPVATMATALRKRGTICRHVFHLNGRRIKGFRKAMQLTGHKTQAVYRRYAITSEADLREGVERLNEATGTKRWDNRADANAEAKPQSA